jgi:hypothetical protein
LLLTALSPKALPVFSFVLLRKIMFNRKMFVALVVCLAMSVSTALAGGGGAKKDSTIKVVNSGPNPIYAFVDVTDAKIQEAANSSDPIKAFNALGGKQIASGHSSRHRLGRASRKAICDDEQGQDLDRHFLRFDCIK